MLVVYLLFLYAEIPEAIVGITEGVVDGTTEIVGVGLIVVVVSLGLLDNNGVGGYVANALAFA